MIRFRDRHLIIEPPEWVSRLVIGRARWDAAIRSVEERAEIHGKAAITLQLGPVARCEITAERVD